MIDITLDNIAAIQDIDVGSVFGAAILLFGNSLNTYVADNLTSSINASIWFSDYIDTHENWREDLDYIKEQLSTF